VWIKDGGDVDRRGALGRRITKESIKETLKEKNIEEIRFSGKFSLIHRTSCHKSWINHITGCTINRKHVRETGARWHKRQIGVQFRRKKQRKSYRKISLL